MPLPRPLVLPLLLAMALAGCGVAELSSARPEGQTAVAVALLGPRDFAAAGVQLTVSGGLGEPFDPITVMLSGGASSWTAKISGIPAGQGRRFDVMVLDRIGYARLTGSANCDVTPGGSSSLAMMLQAAPPASYSDSAPILDRLSASGQEAAPGGFVDLEAVAHDPDPGQAVAYHWIATCGAFDAPMSGRVRWTAPAVGPATCELSVEVSDSLGVGVAASLTVAVR